MSENFVLLVTISSFLVLGQCQTNCGSAGSASGLVVNGAQSQRGAWPWIAALSTADNDGFFCGGTLTSDKIVVTAAHCIQGKNIENSLTPSQIIVKLGRFDISQRWERGSDTVGVKKIVMHPDWNIHDQRYDSDITILVLDQRVRITDSIFPICLPAADDQKVLSVYEGIVAGWGKSEKATRHEDILKQVELTIDKSNEDCFYSDSRITAIASKNTFCAGGSKLGSGPCSGDSGGGLYVKVGNNWFLRGIVSASFLANGECDVNSKAIYTNALKFIDWIEEISVSDGDQLPSSKLQSSSPTKSSRNNSTSTSISQAGKGKIFGECELMQRLVYSGSPTFSRDKLPDWDCILLHESNYNSGIKISSSPDGSSDFGMFKINSKYWCGIDQPGGDCNIECNKFLDADLADDIKCAEKIHGVHGFEAWFGWKNHCKDKKLPDIHHCFF